MDRHEPSDIDLLKLQIENLSRQLAVQKEFAALREQVNIELSRLKWTGATFGLLIAFLGFFGIRAWKDLTEGAQKELDTQVSSLSTEAFALSRGFVLADVRRYREAIPYLIQSYERNHYDETVDSTLLDAFISDNDYSSALNIVSELKKDEKRFRAITNPLLYNNIGRVLMFYAIDKPELLDEAEQMLQKSLRLFPADAPSSKYPKFNLFRLYVVKGDYKRAAQYLIGAYRIDKGYGAESYVSDVWLTKLQSKMPEARKAAQRVIAEVSKSSPN